jgi:IstB-like ATP binding protein
VFGSERLTGALLDRLTHHVHILEMNGDSYRLKQSRQRQRRTWPDPWSACHGARFGEGPVAMLALLRVAPLLASPTLRTAATGPQVGTGKQAHQSNWKAEFAVALLGPP